MATESEGTLAGEGVKFYTKTWTPQGQVKAKLVFVHGFNDHANRYNEFFSRLCEKGIQVFSWDQRGWGHTVTKPADRGVTGPTSLVLADMAAFIKDKLPSDVPLFVMGHSMGGAQVIVFAADPKFADIVSQVRGWIVEGPFISLSPDQKPNPVVLFVGRALSKVLPKQQMKQAIPPENTSRDPAVVESYRNDPLCHEMGSLEGLAGMMDRATALDTGKVIAGKGIKSLLHTHGANDKITSFDASVKWFKSLQVEDKTSKVYEDAYHQLHSDFCKDAFTKDVVDWILERATSAVHTAKI